ncbi:MAG: ADP-dependent glucokinase/phosphofructokinase, partial [Thermomicrobiales bacterium]
GRVVHARTVDDLLTGIAQCVRAGSGIDLPVDDPGVQQWLLDHAPGRSQIGGTGAQAAATLDRLGFPSLVHLTGRSGEQIAALEGGPEMRISTPRGPVVAADAIQPGDPTMWHLALEFGAGLAIPAAAGGGISPAGDRVIVSHDPVNADFRIDPAYVAEVAGAGDRIPAALISGFSQVTDPARLERVLADAAVELRRWRAEHPGLLVHLELGAMPRPELLPMVLDALAPHVGSIGLNEDELRDLDDPNRTEAAFGHAERLGALCRLADRLPTPRIGLHTRAGCLSLTTGDPERERDALLFGSLAAAARVNVGRFPAFDDCRETLASADVRLAAPPPASGPAGRAVVVTPGLRLARQAASVGLGDTFTAGLLAALTMR